jgi:SagB-type dehydrogenase family enzyme
MTARMRDDADELRPLLAGTVRWDDGAAVVDLGSREARVAGDVDRLRTILGACDGRSTLGQLATRIGPDVRELVAMLAVEGAIIDAEQAWRVLHRQSSVGSALGRPIDDQELAALGQATFAPATASQRTVALEPPASAVGELAARRRSTSPGDQPVEATFPLVSAILAAAYTVTPSFGATPNRGTVASAGALYPLVVHLLLREPLGPADPGLWWHDPRTALLHRIGDVAQDTAALFVAEPGLMGLLERRQPIVFLSADLARPSRKYGPRGYRYALIEAGAAMQAAQLTAVELGLPLRPIGGIDDGAVHRFLDLPDSAVALLALMAGS